MYTHCIFCSTDLGRNEILPTFPVGRAIAIDAHRGRLWAICRACGRWNLAPIEERWEPVELAEEAYHNTRLRVQRSNIGLAQLSDGTRLVRIGDALEGETAAWRYGLTLKRRRSRYLRVATVTGTAVATVAAASLAGLATGSLPLLAGITIAEIREWRVVARVTTSSGFRVLRRWHVKGMNLALGADGPQVMVRDSRTMRNVWSWPFDGGVSRRTDDIVVVQGYHASDLLARALVYVNTHGASQNRVLEALKVLQGQPSPEQFLRQLAASNYALGGRAGRSPTKLPGLHAVAVEMAVNESAERLALEGELAYLRAAWAEAEEIAGIADSLPFPPVHRP